jgi:flavin reductase (DIM6/NTAB) family NADH-FMN oxidoreductase RutF
MRHRIDNNAFPFPMPMVLLGSMVNGKPNFMAVAWVSRVNIHPPLIAVALGAHLTNQGIRAGKEFSISVPGMALLEKTDYCGLFSGAKADKSSLFKVYYGELKNAPLIEECPVSLACRLFQAVPLPDHELYIGQIAEAYCDPAYKSDGNPDIMKIKPFLLSMPDNRYWGVGDSAGKAWSAGMELRKTLQQRP